MSLCIKVFVVISWILLPFASFGLEFIDHANARIKRQGQITVINLDRNQPLPTVVDSNSNFDFLLGAGQVLRGGFNAYGRYSNEMGINDPWGLNFAGNAYPFGVGLAFPLGTKIIDLRGKGTNSNNGDQLARQSQ